MGVVTDLTDKFKNIPLGLKSLVDVGVKSGASSQQYKFSQSLKAYVPIYTEITCKWRMRAKVFE